MKGTTLKYGLVIGLVISCAMAGSSMLAGDPPDFGMMEVVGWTSMVLALLGIFLGVKAIREEKGGKIGFTEAFLKGLAIAAIAGGVVGLYTVVHIGVFDTEYSDQYMAYEMQKITESGMSQAEIREEIEFMEDLRPYLDNPFAQGAIMLLTVFIVGLLVSLGSGAVLKNYE